MDTAISSLLRLLGRGSVLTEREDLIPYAFDGTAGLERRLPACVAFPKTTEQVAEVVKLAAASGTAIVPRGNGTGLSGGSVPSADCLVLCLSDMNRLLETDARNLTLLAEAGAVTQDVAAEAARHGLFYPPDPGSMKISAIGGNVANNSGGLRGLKYGVTRDYVMGLEVVLADGRVVWLGGKCVKDVAGYSMKDVFVGSEGTLGVITRVLLKLVPRPKARRTLLAAYDSMEAAAETVSQIVARKIIPCTMEFLDRKTIECVEAYAKIGLPAGAEALVLMESDGHPAAVADEAAEMEGVAREQGALEVTVARDEAEGARLAEARRSAFSALARIRPTTILEDVTVPRSELARMVGAIREIAARNRLEIAIFGHLGDGNLHPTILTDEKDEGEMERVETALGEIVDAALACGGTITGEHGVGLAKKPYMTRQFGEGSLELLRQLKRTLDPQGVFNPGKLLD